MEDTISIHAPQWGATSMNLLWRHTEAYFNPRTPVGCDGGLTVESTNSHEFQSTHPSGVRRDAHPATDYYSIFQSTHPSGVRLSKSSAPPNVSRISIHAPQWGATFNRP